MLQKNLGGLGPQQTHTFRFLIPLHWLRLGPYEQDSFHSSQKTF